MSLELQRGSSVGKYVLDDCLGSGSFGVVWRGHAEGDERPVAVKLLTGVLASDETASIRAEVELLAAAASRRSMHVVEVLDGGSEPVPYIVMEFIQGGDLQSLLHDQGRLSIKRTIEVGLAVSDALRALYQAGIIHRDIKPANVMIDQEGVVKLADFGIARIVGYATISVAGQTAMTMAYAAPEIWDEDGPFGRPSHRSDLYAMGTLLYQCLTGSTPFSGNSTTLYKAHTERLPDLNALPAETPASLRILIGRCLAKRQQERPKDAGACIELLRRAEVELAEAAGDALNEPRKLGPWLKDRPHESVPWAWRCHHERTGAAATVEVYFSDDLEFGTHLADVVSANTGLASLGAERLIGSNRLLLYPNESWRAAPPGQFQFWLAREDQEVDQADPVTAPILRKAVTALEGLLATAAGKRTVLDFGRNNLTVTPDGGVYLRRPGLDTPETAVEADLFATLLALPLDPQARRIMNSVADLPSLVAELGGTVDATVIVDRTEIVPPEQATIVVARKPPTDRPPKDQGAAAEPAVEAPTPAVGAFETGSAVQAELQTLQPSTRFGAARYQLLLRNHASSERRLRLAGHSSDADVALPAEVLLAAGSTRALGVSVQPRKHRWLGKPSERAFAVTVADEEAGLLRTCEATFHDQTRSLLVAATGGLGLLSLAVVLLVFLSGSGGAGQKAAAAATAAREHLTSYEFAAALDEFNRAIELNPANASYFHGRARAQLNLGDLKSAAEDADQAIALDSSSAEAYFVRSLIFDWQELRDDAIAAATKAITLNPNNAEYYALRSLIYGERDADKQKADVEKALRIAPDAPDVHGALGAAYRVQKRYQEAEAAYAKAVSLDAKNGLRYARQAGYFFNRRDYERALAVLDENMDAIGSYPLSDAEGHWLRGAVYVRQNKYQEAIKEITKAVALVPLAPAFLDWRGYTYYLLEDYKSAITDLSKAIELSPSFEDPYYVRSLVEREQGETDAALKDVKRAIALDPTDSIYHVSLASLYLSMENYPGTIAEASKAIELDASSAEAYNLRSLAKGEQNLLNESLADISKAIELEPKSALYYANRGAAYIDLKNYQAAVDDFNKAIGIDGSNAGFYNRRGVAYSWLDNDQAAIEDYNRAIRIAPNNFRYYMNRGIAESNLRRYADARTDYERAKALAATPAQTQEAQAAIDKLPR